MGHRTPPRFVTRTMATTFGTVVFILIAVLRAHERPDGNATLRMDDHRHDTAAARAAHKSALVAFTRS